MNFSKKGLSVLLALTALVVQIAAVGVVQAEDKIDPPRTQTAAGYTIEFVAPLAQANHDADSQVTVRFRVTDAKGQPVNGLNLTVTALRDYSGQVTNEHNGPRVPNIGPLALVSTAQGGEYEATLRFGINGHWFVQVGGSALQGEAVKFRTPIGASDSKGTGFNLDWLLWVGVLLAVLTVIALTWRKGEVFPTPVEELEPPLEATEKKKSGPEMAAQEVLGKAGF